MSSGQTKLLLCYTADTGPITEFDFVLDSSLFLRLLVAVTKVRNKNVRQTLDDAVTVANISNLSTDNFDTCSFLPVMYLDPVMYLHVCYVCLSKSNSMNPGETLINIF